MVKSTHTSAHPFVRALRRIYNPIGFSKGYNFTLFFIFCGALLGFSLARIQFVDLNGRFCGPPSGTNHALPGECFYYTVGHEKIGMILHLVCILPASLLVCFQFLPVIRHKALIIHRINGYIVLVLSFAGTAGAIMVARHAFGGGLDVQMAAGFLSIIFIVSLVLAYVNIKRLQLEEHRAWMLRAWFYAGTIITVRIISFAAATIISNIGSYYQLRECAQVEKAFGDFGNLTAVAYPECTWYMAGNDAHGLARVKADRNGSPIELGAAFGIMFGGALWLSIGLHAAGVEIYVCVRNAPASWITVREELRLTPAESNRLRNISYQRQLEAGMKNPGAAGFTADKLGDAEPWQPRYETTSPEDNSKAVQLEERTSYQGAGTPMQGAGGNGDTAQPASQSLVHNY